MDPLFYDTFQLLYTCMRSTFKEHKTIFITQTHLFWFLHLIAFMANTETIKQLQMMIYNDNWQFLITDNFHYITMGLAPVL